ncbi:MAG: hypothetical protein JO061_19440 [Acidobacteriaceae bacterium]|nr:hypothetical protein [Acidobacteriaceae bacterium]
MRRKRFQKGTVGERKHGRKKVWVGQWWENGSRRSKVLGKVSELTKTDAEGLLSKILQPINGDATENGVPIFTFGDYVNSVYLPTCRERWKESTRVTSEPVIQQHLCSELGGLLMAGIKRPHLQAFLKRKAPTSSRSVFEHLRWHLSGIFKLAWSDGVVDHNPAGELFVPECKPEGEKLVMTAEQIRLAFTVFNLRDRLIFRLAVFEGMRPGEILGIRLGKISGNALLMTSASIAAKWTHPKDERVRRLRGRSRYRRVQLPTSSSGCRCCPIRNPTHFCFHRSATRRCGATTFGTAPCNPLLRLWDSAGQSFRCCGEPTQA